MAAHPSPKTRPLWGAFSAQHPSLGRGQTPPCREDCAQMSGDRLSRVHDPLLRQTAFSIEQMAPGGIDRPDAGVVRAPDFEHAKRRLLTILGRPAQGTKEDPKRKAVEVHTLRGMLPVCAWCKKVRTDSGLWTEAARYLESHPDVRITHGLCPSCLEAQLAAPDEYR